MFLALIFYMCEGSSQAIKHAKKLWYQYFWLWRPQSLTHTVEAVVPIIESTDRYSKKLSKFVLSTLDELPNRTCFLLEIFKFEKTRNSGADAIKKFTPSLGIPYLWVKTPR